MCSNSFSIILCAVVHCSEIQQLLNVSFARGSPDDHHYPPKDSYILLVSVNVTESQSFWSGKTIEIKASTETTINLSELQVCEDC